MDTFPKIYIHDSPETALILAKSSFGIKRAKVGGKQKESTLWIQGLDTGQVAYGIGCLSEISQATEIADVLEEVLRFALTEL